jgi:hypothetical protein
LRKPKQYLAENVISPTSTRGLPPGDGPGRFCAGHPQQHQQAQGE